MKVTPEIIEAAFGKLLKKLTIIANLSTPRRKAKIGKGCPWWCPKVEEANAKAKRDYRSYLAAPSDYRWAEYKKSTAIAKRTVEEAKASSWRRAIAATAHKQEEL
jgi:radical SAM superfamily enzyme